jgi:predicted metal-dependent phosphoesterase TrpH
MFNVDLHCHSTISDGVLTPAEVALRAKNNGVDIWALTDHDEVKGISAARQAAKECGLRYITGVEISVTWAKKTVHIVGLQIDETNPELIHGLEKTRQGRTNRAFKISNELAQHGIPDALEGAKKYVGNTDLISRTHFARYIVELGLYSNVNEVFKHYLIENKPGFIPHQWATLKDAVDWIVNANGIAVIAHPGRYHYNELAFHALLDEFKQLGGKAIEVVTGNHTKDQYEHYAHVAKKYGFLASRGSDFHSPKESHFDLGKLPPLPLGLTPIWHNW